jgi:hypothetical protein
MVAREWRRAGLKPHRLEHYMAHTSQEFVAFLTDLVANQPRGQEIHVIADNLSAIRPGGLSNSSPLTPNSTST